MAIIDIVSGDIFLTVSDAIANSNPGAIIQLPAGTYSEDFPKIRHDLTLQGVGGLARLTPLPTLNPQPGDPVYQAPTNGQGILVTRANVTLDHLELTGAAVPDMNGAGVRYETGSLTITHSWLHGNQNGLLANPNPGASITIAHSEFDHNGAGDGQSHNLYVGQIGTLTLTDSYFHDANVGHEIKSRAEVTTITGTRIQDGPGAATSYSVDLPNGGIVAITGNIITKGPDALNWFIFHFGGEGDATPGNPLLTTTYPGSSLLISDNLITSDLPNADAGGLVDHPALLAQGGDANSQIILPTITGNMFRHIPAEQVLYGPLNGQMQYYPGGAYLNDNSFDVPEPATAVLLVIALAAGVLIRRAALRNA